MQLEFDWSRRERCALANLKSLSDAGVSVVQNAVVYLLQMHPAARLLEEERKVMALRITQAAAARWLKGNCPPVKHLELHRSTFRRAVWDWTNRGVGGFVGPNIVFNFSALIAWHQLREIEDQDLLAGLERVTECDRALPSVTERNPSVSEGEKEFKENLSITPSTGIFSNLPAAIWDAELTSESRLYESLKAWWQAEGESYGFAMDQVVGAILAARTGKANPIRYATTCLDRGVNEDWVIKAYNFRQRMKQAAVYTGR